MIDYLVLGHICTDLQPDGSTRLGGTGLFASLTAHRLGLRTAVVTACTDDFDLSLLPPDLLVLRQPSPQTTVFENRYHADGRTQLLHARARSIELGPGGITLPEACWKAPIVHLAPIIQEVPKDGCALFEGAIVGTTPQGWIRTFDAPGASPSVVTTDPKTLLTLPWAGREIVVLSEEDVQHDEALVRELARVLPLVVLTRAEHGCTVFISGQPNDIPAYHADAVDPTGAGDVFAAAFFSALHGHGGRHDDPVHAAQWACAAAACSVEGYGASALPTAEDVRRRMSGAS